MAESVDLTAPVARPSITNYALDYLTLDVGTSTILVVLKSNAGDTIQKVYNSTTNPTGAALLSSLNTSNNSGANPSLIKKVYNRLLADGVLVGNVNGSPQ